MGTVDSPRVTIDWAAAPAVFSANGDVSRMSSTSRAGGTDTRRACTVPSGETTQMNNSSSPTQ